jgi:hypothetical protein
MLNFLGIWASNVQIHIFVALPASSMLHESRTTALDLHAAARFLLDVLNIGAPVTYNLSSQVKAWDRFKTDRNLLLWPFALHTLLAVISINMTYTYSAELVTLNSIWFSSSEASFINKVGQFLFHQFFYLFDSLLKANFARARNMQVKWWVLRQL